MNFFRNSTITAALIIPFFLLMGSAGASWGITDMLQDNGPKIIGTEVAIEDITEFYYTYSTSTYPPKYQRYHFSVKDGDYLFYHEKREGRHWPLDEKDITVSGTIKLSREEWNQFFDYVKGGKVEKRKEHLETGGRGPWLFLYWKGDQSKIQEFTFANYGKQTAFENFCVKLKNEEENH